MWADGEGFLRILHEELGDFIEVGTLGRLVIRLLVAMAAGALLGYQREHVGKPAGLRTHMIVSLGAALFTALPTLMHMDPQAVSRIIQGVAAGIGFIGGGAILKLSDKQQIRGLTTAASLWLAAAVGVAAGLGRPGSALLGAGLGLVILAVVGWMEYRLEGPRK
jgi:putative Mg2+ transporter-C (MgtC) family protein